MQNQKALKLDRDGAFRNILYSPTIDEYQANVKQITSSFKSSRPKFLNQTIVDLVKSFIRENKPDQAIEVLQSVGFGDGLAEFFVIGMMMGVLR
jgi:hypothetical protein